MPRTPKLTVQEMQRRSTEAQKKKAGSDEAYRKTMAERASLRKTKGNFTNHPTQEKTAT